MALLVVGIVGALVLLPTYLRARNGAVGNEGKVAPGDLLVASDALRFTAWGAAGRMWIDAPLTGHGFMSYLSLHETYGDPILRSPHNEWLRLFAEGGVVTGVAGIVFVLATFGALARRTGLVATGALAGF